MKPRLPVSLCRRYPTTSTRILPVTLPVECGVVEFSRALTEGLCWQLPPSDLNDLRACGVGSFGSLCSQVNASLASAFSFAPETLVPEVSLARPIQRLCGLSSSDRMLPMLQQ